MIIKALSFNMHKGVSWLMNAPTLHKIKKEVSGLLPDLILMQEVLQSHSQFLLSEQLPYFASGMNKITKNGSHGNVIFSRFPISFTQNIDISAGRFEKRGLLHTITQLKPKTTLHLICVHLGLLKKYRNKQFEMILKFVEDNIQSHEHLIIGGDFNDWGKHANHLLTDRLNLQECFHKDQGKHAKTYPSWIPLLQLDRIYIRGFEICTTKRLTQTKWKQLSDHIALKAELKFLKKFA